MNEITICPKCGAPRAWEMWGQCACGHEFGPPPPELAIGPLPLDAPAPVSTLRYRTFWPRLLAGTLDGLVFLPVSLLDPYLSSPARGSFVLIVWAVIAYTAFWLYSVLLHARSGQTLGKRAAGVKVLDVSETRVPTLRQAFIRDIGSVVLNTISLIYFIYLVLAGLYTPDAEISTVPGQILLYANLGWFLLEIISMATNKKRRAFHDFIAGTVVVNESRYELPGATRL